MNRPGDYVLVVNTHTRRSGEHVVVVNTHKVLLCEHVVAFDIHAWDYLVNMSLVSIHIETTW